MGRPTRTRLPWGTDMAAYVTANVHADIGEVSAHRLTDSSIVVLRVGPVTIFPESDGVSCTKATALAWLARWTVLVEALPDDEGGA